MNKRFTQIRFKKNIDDSAAAWFDRAAIAGDVAPMASILESPESEVDVNRRITGTEAQTALHIAAFENDPGMTRLLLQHGADKNLCDGSGQTALEIARKYRYPKVIMLLEDDANGSKAAT